MVSLKCTAIISDLHLTDAEPSRPHYHVRHPLWKKFKTKEFFIDEALVHFLYFIENKANGLKVELVLNGDIFDFDSVMAQPEHPIYKVNWLETRRGLFPKQERSEFKMKVIMEEHQIFFDELKLFVKRGHSVVLIPGNHDVELHFESVQKIFLDFFELSEHQKDLVKIVKWFYISEHDTFIEHGHQQDPYCMCENPLNPFLIDYNELRIRLPFGNVACRYMMNGLGLFNPHVEKNYIMSLSEYLNFFFKYLVKAQPLIIWTWFWGALATMIHVTFDRFAESYKSHKTTEEIVEETAKVSQSSPAVVRLLQELFPRPASQDPLLIAKELWLDRAFLIFFGLILSLLLGQQMNYWFGISALWIIIPVLLLVPFFLFYARSVTSLVSSYKEPDELLFAKQAEITGVKRIIYGHTHIPCHEFYGGVEHLNSGTWSPGFTNVECTETLERNNFVWIEPKTTDKHETGVSSPDSRVATLMQFKKENWLNAAK